MKAAIAVFVLLIAGISALKLRQHHKAASGYAFFKTENEYTKEQANEPLRHSHIDEMNISEPKSEQEVAQESEEEHLIKEHEEFERLQKDNEDYDEAQSEKLKEETKFNEIMTRF